MYGYFLFFCHCNCCITYFTYGTYHTYYVRFQNWTVTKLSYFTMSTQVTPWKGMLEKQNLRISSIISMNARSRGPVLGYAHLVVQMVLWHFKVFRKLLAMQFLCAASFMQIKQAQQNIVHTTPFTVHGRFEYHLLYLYYLYIMFSQ